MQTAVAFGTFDGMHIGHREVLERTKDHKSVAVTFRFPPKFENATDNLLMSPERKIEALKNFGIDLVKVFDFSEIKDIEARQFLDIIKKEFSPDVFSCGFNFRFGKGAKGDTELLEKYCKENGIKLFINAPVCSEGEPVSSTGIRKMIENGEIERANKLLFEDFSFSSDVVHGDARGRNLGFPTINQIFPEILAKPRFGVYETRVIVNGKEYKSITNIGKRPTFETEKITAETNIKDFCDNVYGKEIKLVFKRFIRDERRFKNEKELVEQIKKDITEVYL